MVLGKDPAMLVLAMLPIPVLPQVTIPVLCLEAGLQHNKEHKEQHKDLRKDPHKGIQDMDRANKEND